MPGAARRRLGRIVLGRCAPVGEVCGRVPGRQRRRSPRTCAPSRYVYSLVEATACPGITVALGASATSARQPFQGGNSPASARLQRSAPFPFEEVPPRAGHLDTDVSAQCGGPNNVGGRSRNSFDSLFSRPRLAATRVNKSHRSLTARRCCFESVRTILTREISASPYQPSDRPLCRLRLRDILLSSCTLRELLHVASALVRLAARSLRAARRESSPHDRGATSSMT